MNIGIKVRKQHLAFISFLIEKYGSVINRVSMADIALLYGTSTTNVLNYINRLQDFSYLAVDKVSSKKWVITINVEKVNSVINGKNCI